MIIFRKIFLSGCYECLHVRWPVINGVAFTWLMSYNSYKVRLPLQLVSAERCTRCPGNMAHMTVCNALFLHRSSSIILKAAQSTPLFTHLLHYGLYFILLMGNARLECIYVGNQKSFLCNNVFCGIKLTSLHSLFVFVAYLAFTWQLDARC